MCTCSHPTHFACICSGNDDVLIVENGRAVAVAAVAIPAPSFAADSIQRHLVAQVCAVVRDIDRDMGHHRDVGHFMGIWDIL